MEEYKYNKIIQTGDTIEIYQYENRPNTGPKRGRRKKKNSNLVNLKPRERRFDNVGRQKQSFRRLVRANTRESEPPMLVTLTYGGIVEIQQGYNDFNKFIKRLRHTFGKSFRYIAVPEFQDRGSVHFHSLFWGLPERLASNERKTREIAHTWNLGFVDIRLTDGSPKLIGYLTKYMTKSLTDVRLGGKKAYTCSRNVQRPVTHRNSIVFDYSKEIWGIDLSTDEPIQNRHFHTEWLGRANYKRYKININGNKN